MIAVGPSDGSSSGTSSASASSQTTTPAIVAIYGCSVEQIQSNMDKAAQILAERSRSSEWPALNEVWYHVSKWCQFAQAALDFFNCTGRGRCTSKIGTVENKDHKWY